MKQNNQISDAKTYLKDVLTRSPRVPEFTLFQAHLEEQSQNMPEAISILEKAVLDFPEDEKLHYYLGSLYDRQGAIQKSLKEMEYIVVLNPKHVDALNYLGYTWTNEGIRLFDAEKVLRKAMGLSPKNAYVQDSWGWYLFVRGRMKEAVIELEKAASLKADEPTILEHLGDAYLKVNLREKALSQYLKAKKHAPSDEIRKKIQIKVDTLLRESVVKDEP